MRVRRLGDGRQIARDCRRSRATERLRSSSHRRSPRRCLRSPAGQAASGRFCRPPYAPASRKRRHIGDAARRKCTDLLRRVRRCAISIASPHAVEPSYIEAFATSIPVSAPPGSGIRTEPAECLARSPVDRACSWSEIPNAGSDDRPSPAYDADRRRRREKTAPSRRRRSRLAIAVSARSTAISLIRERQIEKTLDPLVGGDVGEQRFDVGDADAGQHRLAFARVERQVAHGFKPKS